MERRIRRGLQRLEHANPDELRLVDIHIRWRRIRYTIITLPFIAKLSIAHALALVWMFILMPPPVHRPAISLVFVWAAAFCFGFMVAASLPYRQRKAHWLMAIVDDRYEKLYWE